MGIKGSKIAEDKAIVAEAKKEFGHLSEQLRNAEFLKQATAALRALALELAATNPNVCDRILRFQKKHKLAGI